MRRLENRKLRRKAPNSPALCTVVAKVVTFSATYPAKADGAVTDAGAGTLRTPGDRPQSTSEDGEAQLNAIVPWKPLMAVTDTGVAADWPCATENGEAEKLKSSVPSTV
jgi:hypothetical protein